MTPGVKTTSKLFRNRCQNPFQYWGLFSGSSKGKNAITQPRNQVLMKPTLLFVSNPPKAPRSGMTARVALGVAVCVVPALAQEADASRSTWKTTASVGATLTRGNSDTVTATATLNSERKWAQNEFFLGAALTYGETDDTTTASSATGFVQYNRLFSERFYGYARLDAYHDDVADIAYRITFSGGAGYYFIKTDKITLSGEVGPGYILEKFHNRTERDYATLRLGEKFTWQISQNARLWQSLDYTPSIDEWSDYLLTAEIGIATKITESLDLRVVALDNYRSKPAPGRTENDFKLIAGIGYTF